MMTAESWKEMTIIDIQLSNKNIVVVTGAASGIGQSIAIAYQARGNVVIGLDRNPVREPFPLIQCDISKEDDIREAFDEIKSEHGKIHYLVNAAGIFIYQKRCRIEEMELDSWEQVLKTNLTGTMLVTRGAIPLLKQATGDRGIVNISSDQSFYPRTKNAAYAVSKAGITCLTELAARELLPDGIRVNGIAPASVRTNFISEMAGGKKRMNEIYECENNRMPYGLIDVEDITNLAVFLGSENAKKITGQMILVDSGLYSKET